MRAELAENTIAAWYLVSSFFGRAFDTAPNQEFISLLGADALREAFDLVGFDPDDGGLQGLLGALDEVASVDAAAVTATGDAAPAVERLCADYTRLFVGPESLPGKPWECIHRSGRDEILQPSTLEVRRFYRRAGYLPASCHRVSDDFLPIEANFVQVLLGEAAKSLEAEDGSAVRENLALLEEFLREHVLVWIRSYSKALGEALGEGGIVLNCAFYPAAVAAFAGFCEVLAREIGDGCAAGNEPVA